MGGKTAGTNAVTEFHKQFKVEFQEIFNSEHRDLGAVEELCLMKERLFLVQEERGELSEMTEAGTELYLSLNIP